MAKLLLAAVALCAAASAASAIRHAPLFIDDGIKPLKGEPITTDFEPALTVAFHERAAENHLKRHGVHRHARRDVEAAAAAPAPAAGPATGAFANIADFGGSFAKGGAGLAGNIARGGLSVTLGAANAGLGVGQRVVDAGVGVVQGIAGRLNVPVAAAAALPAQ